VGVVYVALDDRDNLRIRLWSTHRLHSMCWPRSARLRA